MRIGILTLPLNTNYGGILQAYALQSVLERMGHEVVVFNKPMKFIMGRKNQIKRFLGVNRYQFDLKRFVEENIHNLWIEDFNELKPDDFDAIVVGSDQVWRKDYFSVFSENFEDAFLGFAKNWQIKRLSYAASFGYDEWHEDKETTIKCRELLSLFDAVSVREESGQKICCQTFGTKSIVSIDPTMLLSLSNYKQFITPDDKGGILNYILDADKEKNNFIDKLKTILNRKTFSVNPTSKRTFKNFSIENWLSGFYNAGIVVTDSFHACVFSILFHKPFYVLANRERGISRIKNLLSLFKLEHLLVRDTTFEFRIPLIDWDNVDKILEKERSLSFKYLQNNLI